MGSSSNVIRGTCDDEMKKLTAKVIEIEDMFRVNAEQLKAIASDMEDMMQNGLKDENSSSIKMLVTFVDTLPTGDEEGCYYALDLGGTNLRVMRVMFQGDGTVDLNRKRKSVPPEFKIGKLNALFDYIAEQVSVFIKEEGLSDFVVLPGRKKELGFTFSFPVHQTRINSGTLLNWTKDFNIEEAIQKDMVEELSKALARHGIDISVTALLNDAVGCLAGGRFYDKNVIAAVILGTGFNASYVEKAGNILKTYGSSPKSEQMVINTEWGNFNSLSLPLTKFDRALDEDSPNRHKQVLEKMLSGRYLGEFFRRILLWLAEEVSLCGTIVPAKLRVPYTFESENVSAMYGDMTENLDVVAKRLLEKFEITDSSLSFEKRQLIVKICEVVTTRGARLSAAAILAILKRLGKDKEIQGEPVVIAVDGALFKNYNACLEKTLNQELLDKEVSKKVVLREYEDVSGIGAALVAASHSIY